jgi:hypothetical protein
MSGNQYRRKCRRRKREKKLKIEGVNDEGIGVAS